MSGVQPIPPSLRAIADRNDQDILRQREAIGAECKRLGLVPIFDSNDRSSTYGRLVGVKKGGGGEAMTSVRVANMDGTIHVAGGRCCGGGTCPRCGGHDHRQGTTFGLMLLCEQCCNDDFEWTTIEMRDPTRPPAARPPRAPE